MAITLSKPNRFPKFFHRRLGFDKVIAISWWSTFWGTQCSVASPLHSKTLISNISTNNRQCSPNISIYNQPLNQSFKKFKWMCNERNYANVSYRRTSHSNAVIQRFPRLMPERLIAVNHFRVNVIKLHYSCNFVTFWIILCVIWQEYEIAQRTQLPLLGRCLTQVLVTMYTFVCQQWDHQLMNADTIIIDQRLSLQHRN